LPLPDSVVIEAPDGVCEMSNVPVPLTATPLETAIEPPFNNASVAPVSIVVVPV
jgi:hypothetical protein